LTIQQKQRRISIMKIAVDLHSHSGYAGGTKNISLEGLASSMILKGIDVLGTGDCLFPVWQKELENKLREDAEGIFIIDSPQRTFYGLRISQLQKSARFILQTELIFTFAEPTIKTRKRMDVVFLFPSFKTTNEAINLLDSWGVKNTVGRPFVVCQDGLEVGDRIYQILSIDQWIEAIPAHIMTPQGIFGSSNKIDSLKTIFGEKLTSIHAIETGLSADPPILDIIPELNNFTFISNSDLHSAGLDKLGREFTCLDVSWINYNNIIQSIRTNHVAYTCELNPGEGRYYFTGHKGNRPGHGGDICVYAPNQSPKNYICPVCNRELCIGVAERAEYLKMRQSRIDAPNKKQRNFITTIPLLEIIRYTGYKDKQAYAVYKDVIIPFGNERALWESSLAEIQKKLSGIIDNKSTDNILKVKRGDFHFNPPGYDGESGKLVIGKKLDLSKFKIEPENLEQAPTQLELF